MAHTILKGTPVKEACITLEKVALKECMMTNGLVSGDTRAQFCERTVGRFPDWLAGTQ